MKTFHSKEDFIKWRKQKISQYSKKFGVLNDEDFKRMMDSFNRFNAFCLETLKINNWKLPKEVVIQKHQYLQEELKSLKNSYRELYPYHELKYTIID